MNRAARAITKSIDDGSYFTETKEWYFQKFLMPAAQRTAMLIMAALMVIALYVMLDLMRISYSDKSYPFSIFSNDQTKYFPVLNSIGRGNEPINISVARYFASYYVQSREAYSYDNFVGDSLNTTLNAISVLSSRRVFHDYQDSLDTTLNPDSPLTIFKNSVQRTIQVDNVEISSAFPIPDRAKVYFTAIDTSGDGTKKSTRYVADLDFNMSDSVRVIDKQVPLTFLVTRYRTYKL